MFFPESNHNRRCLLENRAGLLTGLQTNGCFNVGWVQQIGSRYGSLSSNGYNQLQQLLFLSLIISEEQINIGSQTQAKRIFGD